MNAASSSQLSPVVRRFGILNFIYTVRAKPQERKGSNRHVGNPLVSHDATPVFRETVHPRMGREPATAGGWTISPATLAYRGIRARADT
jgi:hypothetical protein